EGEQVPLRRGGLEAAQPLGALESAGCWWPPRGRGGARRPLLRRAPLRPTLLPCPRRSWRQRAPTRRRRHSPPIGVPVLDDLLRGRSALGGALAVSNPLEPRVDGGPGGETLELLFEIFLHGLAVSSRPGGELVPDVLGNVPDRDLNAHDGYMPALTAIRKQPSTVRERKGQRRLLDVPPDSPVRGRHDHERSELCPRLPGAP